MTQHLAEVEVVDIIISLDSSLVINYLYTLNVLWGNNCIAWA